MSGSKLAAFCNGLGLLVLLAGCAVRTQDDVSIARPGGLDRALFGNYWKAHHKHQRNAEQEIICRCFERIADVSTQQ